MGLLLLLLQLLLLELVHKVIVDLGRDLGQVVLVSDQHVLIDLRTIEQHTSDLRCKFTIRLVDVWVDAITNLLLLGVNLLWSKLALRHLLLLHLLLLHLCLWVLLLLSSNLLGLHLWEGTWLLLHVHLILLHLTTLGLAPRTLATESTVVLLLATTATTLSTSLVLVVRTAASLLEVTSSSVLSDDWLHHFDDLTKTALLAFGLQFLWRDPKLDA